MYCTIFGDEALNRTTVSEWHSRVMTSCHSFEDDKRSPQPSTCKIDENVKQSCELIRKDCRLTIQELAYKTKIGYGVCRNFYYRELEHAALCCKVYSKILDKQFLTTTQFLSHNNMVVVPHSNYSPDLAPCDFELFPKLKMELVKWHFATVPIFNKSRRWSLVVFKRMTLLSGCGKRDGIGVCVQKVNILK